jgi:hypothetical protein
MNFATAWLIAQTSAAGQERLTILERDGRVLIAVADGGAGASGGAAASDFVLQEVARAARAVSLRTLDPAGLLSDIYHALVLARLGGQSTGILAIVGEDGVCGASVGDSGALIARSSDLLDLTERQPRRLLLGTGEAEPIEFTSGPFTGTLLVATAGLLKHAPLERVAACVRGLDLASIPRAIVDLVRVRSGMLWNDVAIAACRAG